MPEADAKPHLANALNLLQKGELTMAEGAARHALQAAPNLPAAHALMAEILEGQLAQLANQRLNYQGPPSGRDALTADYADRLQSIDAHHQAAVAAQPPQYTFLLRYARFLAFKSPNGSPARAQQLINQAVELAPEEPEPHILRIDLAIVQDRHLEAQQHLDEARQRFPNDPRPAKLQAKLERVQAIQAQKAALRAKLANRKANNGGTE